MKTKDILKFVSAKTGHTQTELARKEGVSSAAVAKTFSAPKVGASIMVKYLQDMGYRVYAIPDSIEIPTIFKEAIEIDPNEQRKEED